MESVYVAWHANRNMIGVFSTPEEAIEHARKRPAATVERYDLPFIDGDSTEEIWPKDEERSAG